MDYRKKLLDGRWQRKRLEILERDGFCCTMCRRQDNVQIHHNWYLKNMEPWDHSESQLVTLCDGHHDETTELQTRLKQLLSESGPELQREVYEFLLSRKITPAEFFADAPRWVLCELVASEKHSPWMVCDFNVRDEDGNIFASKQRFGLWHDDQHECNRGRGMFSLLCRAVDVLQPDSSSDLHGIECWGHFVGGRINRFRHIDQMGWGDGQ